MSDVHSNPAALKAADGGRTEIAAARRYAVYRFAFPEGSVPRVLFDNAWTLNADGKTAFCEKLEGLFR